MLVSGPYAPHEPRPQHQADHSSLPDRQATTHTSAVASAGEPPTSAAAPDFSGVARNVIAWLHHVTRTDTHRHRIASSPPLPRPRPAQLSKAPELPATAVESNEAQPASTTVEPNKISLAPAPAVEPDKATSELPAAAEPNEVPPAAAAGEPNRMREQSAAPAVGLNVISSTPTVEPDKTPAELPPGAVKQTKAPGTPTRTVLQGANIPD